MNAYSAVDSMRSRPSSPPAAIRRRSYSAMRSVTGSMRLTRRRMARPSHVHEWTLLAILIRRAMKDGKCRQSTYGERAILLMSCRFSSSSVMMRRLKALMDSSARTGSIAWVGLERSSIGRGRSRGWCLFQRLWVA